MFKHFSKDLSASVVVFFVALPLCLGIALASGAPLFSGVIAGIVGGIVAGIISGSQLGVSGPAAGLAVIVLSAIASLGSFEAFLLSLVLAGIMQFILGLLKAGVIGYYFPSSVIKGMLAGIGIIIFLKQLPHAVGYDKDYEGDFSFVQLNGENTISALYNMLSHISLGASLVTIISLIILLLWEKVLVKKHSLFKIIPGPLVAVVFGIVFSSVVSKNSMLYIEPQHLVNVPEFQSVNAFFAELRFPDFSAITNTEVWVIAITIAVIASIETLLSVEAADKIDPQKRVTPTNRELFAQGIGNIVCGFIGGLPITQVIVRTSANVQSGGKTKLSAILHGFLLLIAVVSIPSVLNKVPLAVLAAILLLVGYKLAKPALFKEMFSLGKSQFIPFLITVLGIIFTDLLIGIGLGIGVAIVTILWNSYKNSHFLHMESCDTESKHCKMRLAEEVSFLNKGAISRELNELPEGIKVDIDLRNTQSLDYDVIEVLQEFSENAPNKQITLNFITKKGIIQKPTEIKRILMNKVNV